MRRSLSVWVAAAVAVVGLVAATGPATADEPTFDTGASDASSIAIFSGLPGYKNVFWWDHSDLTVAVRAASNVDPDKLQAIHDAIAVWSSTLASEIPEISLTDVTSALPSYAPDILVRYVPHAGGINWSGVANCGVQKCLNVIIRSDIPEGENRSGETDADFNALRVERITMHELGHTLGLGHASPIDTTRDLMGYGWIFANPDLTPILSDCDLTGIRTAFSWVFAHEEPHPSPASRVLC